MGWVLICWANWRTHWGLKESIGQLMRRIQTPGNHRLDQVERLDSSNRVRNGTWPGAYDPDEVPASLTGTLSHSKYLGDPLLEWSGWLDKMVSA